MNSQKTTGFVLLIATYAILSIVTLAGIFSIVEIPVAVIMLCIVVMFALTVIVLHTAGETDRSKANQANRTLSLASRTITFMRQGLNQESAQAVCELLLPSVGSLAVAITDREKVLGFAGADYDLHLPGKPIQSETIKQTIEDGRTRIDDTVMPGSRKGPRRLAAGIVAPFVVNKEIVGTLKFYYGSAHDIDEMQRAMVDGLAELLSTQLSLAALEQQTELATSMELKMLQTQINPHFLFNTINTIASFTRTDPAKARVMLREFALYYRRLLENSEDLIPLSSEIDQTSRYLMFQRARFGEDAIVMDMDIAPGLEELHVPAFIVQPIVENSVGHGRREEGALHILVSAYRQGDDVIIRVDDDGVGIPADKLPHVLDGEVSTGLGIALQNVNARLVGYFGEGSGLSIESEYGTGTTVYLTLAGASAGLEDSLENDLI